MTDAKTGRRPGESGLIPVVTAAWHKPAHKVYRCSVFLLPEEGGSFSVHAAMLPGVSSQGKTEKEALENIVSAIEGVIAGHVAQGEQIPWLKDPLERRKGAKVRWVVVRG
jgi:predicted RNase H-like HicB family nuclease